MEWSVYAIQAGDGPVKVGRAKAPHQRLSELQTGNAEELRLRWRLRKLTSLQSWNYERKLHKRLRRYHVRGEWFTAGVLDVLKELDPPFGRVKIYQGSRRRH